MTQIALSLPKLELLRTEVRALGPDTWRIRFAVGNAGWLPAYVTKRALERKVVRGVIFEIHLPDVAKGANPEVSLVSGKPRIEGAQLEGHAVRSCVTPLSAALGKPVATIEALGAKERPHPLQSAWITHQVPQCGYCQSGMLMAAASLLAHNLNPNDAEIDAAITNICRCGTYPRIREAIRSAAAAMRAAQPRPVPRATPRKLA